MHFPKEEINTKIVGVTHEGRQVYVSRLRNGDQLQLLREQENPYDHNAIAIVDAHSNKLGFINSELAMVLASQLDAGVSYLVTVTVVTGGGIGRSYGVNINLVRANTIEHKNKRQSALSLTTNPTYFREDDFFLDKPKPTSIISSGQTIQLVTQQKKNTSANDNNYKQSPQMWDDDAQSLPHIDCYLDDLAYTEDQYDGEDDPDDLSSEGLGIGDISFEDCDSEYP